MKKHKYHYNMIVVVLLGVVLFFVLLALYPYLQSKNANDSYNNDFEKNQIETRIFQSDLLNFKIEYPSYLEVIDKGINLRLESSDGVITVAVNNTNHESLLAFLDEFDSRRDLNSSEEKSFTLKGFEGMSRIVEFPVESRIQKSVYIYAENSVYIFSTTSPELYDELDQIAESFEYLGD